MVNRLEWIFRAFSTVRQHTPELMEERIRNFVEKCLVNRDIFVTTVEEHGSPLYLLSEGRLRANAREFLSVFGSCFAEVSLFFAVKSNNCKQISSILVQEGLGLDVSSGKELDQALDAGAKKIVFSGPGKTDDEICLAISNPSRVTLLVDSFHELDRVKNLTFRSKQRISIGVRLTTADKPLWRKFGIPLERLGEFLEKSSESAFVSLEGLQFHSSWNLSSEPQVKFIHRLGAVLKSLSPKLVSGIKFIDIGGGYWPSEGEWLRDGGTELGRLKRALNIPGISNDQKFFFESESLKKFAEDIHNALSSALPEHINYTLYLEPGRWLCHNAMHILLRVMDIKEPDIAITDGATNIVGWERFEHDYFPVVNLSNPSPEEKPFNILGSLCTPHDVWGYSFHGTAVNIGDILLVPNQGAYTYSLSQNFIKPVPSVITTEIDIKLL